MVGRVNFKHLGDEAAEQLPQSIKERFEAVFDVTRWEFQTTDGKAPYAGQLVSGPKALPNGSFQCVADIVLTDFPPEGVSQEVLNGLNAIITREFNARAVIKYNDGTLHRPTGELIDPSVLPPQEEF